jgi:hypothetical protein
MGAAGASAEVAAGVEAGCVLTNLFALEGVESADGVDEVEVELEGCEEDREELEEPPELELWPERGGPK